MPSITNRVTTYRLACYGRTSPILSLEMLQKCSKRIGNPTEWWHLFAVPTRACVLSTQLTAASIVPYHPRMGTKPIVPQTMEVDRTWFEDDLMTRFLRYVVVHTTSDPHVSDTPTTARQFDLARILVEELRDLGISEVELTDSCSVIGRVPGSEPGTPIGFMAHMDTAPDFSGENVRPQIHRDYDGNAIALDSAHTLDPVDYPMLSRYVGETIITTDGTTLLGSDDKAGIAEIMTAVRYLREHRDLPYPDLEIAFTPDEETGRGLADFPVSGLRSRFCFTVDGTDEGSIETSCFSAYRAIVTFTGRPIHPGQARGKLANAVAMASMFVSILPRTESPEATDGEYGFYCPTEITGGLAKAEVRLIVRDFEMAEVERRLAFLESAAATVEGAFPGGTVSISTERQYLNMAEFLKPHPDVIDAMEEAIRLTGIEPIVHSIRGGTDGARLSEQGIPTPNLFTGGQNLHGPYEWIALPAMVRSAKTLVNLAQLFCDRQDRVG